MVRKRTKIGESVNVVPCYWCGLMTANLGKVCTRCINEREPLRELRFNKWKEVRGATDQQQAEEGKIGDQLGGPVKAP